GLFWFQIFIQASSPEIWLETISGSEKILAGKSGGLFLGYLLREKNIGSRGEAPPCIVLDPLVEYRLPSISWRWQRNTLRDIVEGLEVRGLMFHRRKFHDARRRSVESIAHRLWTDC